MQGSGLLAIEKTCAMCGRRITVPNNRWKYCEPCGIARKKMFDLNAVHKFRESEKQRRAAQEKQNLDLIEENRLLREQIRALQYRVEALDAALRKR